MKKGKKTISVLLALIMVFGALISAPFAAGAAPYVVMTLDPVNNTVDPGITAEFTLIVEGLGTDPVSNQISSVSFSSSDTEVADNISLSAPSSYIPSGASEPTGLQYAVTAETADAGISIITATVTDTEGNIYTKSGTVTVRGIKVSPRDITLETGEACVLFAERYGFTSGQSLTNLSWRKTSEYGTGSDWITLGARGATGQNEAFYVKGNSEGIGTVTVSLNSGSSAVYSDTVNVTVVRKKSITTQRDSVEVTSPVDLSAESTAELNAVVTDDTFNIEATVTWESSRPDIVSVSPSTADSSVCVISREAFSDDIVAVKATATDGTVTRTKTVYVTSASQSVRIIGAGIIADGAQSGAKTLTLSEGESVVLYTQCNGIDPTATIWSATTGSGRVPVKLSSTVGKNITITGRLSTGGNSPVAVTASNGNLTDTVYVTVLPAAEKSVKITGSELGADGVLVLQPGQTANLRIELAGFGPNSSPDITWQTSLANNNENPTGTGEGPVILDSGYGEIATVTASSAASTDFAKVSVSVREGATIYTDEIYVKVTGSNIINSANYLTIFRNDAVTLQTVSGSADWQSTSFKLYFQDPDNPSPTASNQVTNFSGASATLTAKQNQTTSQPVKITATQNGVTDSVYVKVINSAVRGISTVSFDLNGGYGTTPDPVVFSQDDIPCTFLLKVPDAAYPDDNGKYEFLGWSEFADAYDNFSIQSKPVYPAGRIYSASSSTTLYAIWAKKNEDAVFRIRLDGNIPVEPSNQSVTDYTQSTVFIRGALDPAGFYYNTDGVESHLAKAPSAEDISRIMGLEYVDGQQLSYDPENDRIIWYVVKRVSDDPAGLPCWRVDGVLLRGGKVSLTYDKNTSAANLENFPNPPREFYDAGEYGVAYAGITETVPECSGSTFIGWNTKPDGSGQWFTSTGTLYGGFVPPEGETVQTAVSLTEDMTLYAIWSGVGIRAVWESGEPADEVRVTYGGEEYVLNENNNRVLQLPFSSDDFPEAAAIPGYFSSVREYRIEGSGSEMRYYTITYTKVFDSHALVLSGEIGVVFNVSLSGGLDTDGAYMTYETGKIGSAEQSIEDAVFDDETGLWSFTCYLGAYRMADKITPTFHWLENGEEQTASGEPYSVEDYARYVTDNPGNYESSVVTFCQALIVYGYSAQNYLGKIHGFTVGDGEGDKYAAVSEPGENFFEDMDFSRIFGEINGYAPDKTIDETRVSKVSFALDLESATSLYVNITVKNGAVPTKAQLADGTELNITQRSKNVYRVSLDGIKASRLLDWFTIQVFEGENQIAEVNLSPASYVYLVMNSNASEDIGNLVLSLFFYGYCADKMINP